MSVNTQVDLVKLFGRKEVHLALLFMQGLKVTGPDGIQALFLQRNWEVVCSRIISFSNNDLTDGFCPLSCLTPISL